MKKFILLLTAVFITFQSFAQDPEIFEHDWNVTEFFFQGFFANTPPYPTNDEYGWAGATLYDEGGLEDTMSLACCDNRTWALIFDPVDPQFSLTTYSTFPVGCKNGAYQNFADIYFQFFDDYMNDPFSYELIDEGGGGWTLIFTAFNGDYIVFGNDILANIDVNNKSFSLYPNPVSDVLNISSEGITIETLAIYSVSGQQLIRKSEATSFIDVSALSEGIYFLEIVSENGRQVQKFIKR